MKLRPQVHRRVFAVGRFPDGSEAPPNPEHRVLHRAPIPPAPSDTGRGVTASVGGGLAGIGLAYPIRGVLRSRRAARRDTSSASIIGRPTGCTPPRWAMAVLPDGPTRSLIRSVIPPDQSEEH